MSLSNTISGVTNSAKRTFVVEFFPAIISSWPIVFLIVTYYLDLILKKNETALYLSKYEYAATFLLVIFLYGLGHIISKIGLRLELILENILFESISDGNPIIEIERELLEHFNKKNFYENWYNYLRVGFRKEEEPIIIRYYSALVSGFKFELNMLCSLVIMSINYWIVSEIFMVEIIKCGIYTYSFFLLVLIFLFYIIYESFNAIVEQHKLRIEIIKSFNDQRSWQKLITKC
jgi:hypothetical protein